MTLKFYVDATGKYLGGFDGPPVYDENGVLTGETQDAPAPEGGVEVPHAPDDASQKWNGKGFAALAVAAEVQPDAQALADALKAKGLLTDADINAAMDGAL